MIYDLLRSLLLSRFRCIFCKRCCCNGNHGHHCVTVRHGYRCAVVFHVHAAIAGTRRHCMRVLTIVTWWSLVSVFYNM